MFARSTLPGNPEPPFVERANRKALTLFFFNIFITIKGLRQEPEGINLKNVKDMFQRILFVIILACCGFNGFSVWGQAKSDPSGTVYFNFSNDVNGQDYYFPYEDINDGIAMTHDNNFTSSKRGWEFASLGKRRSLCFAVHIERPVDEDILSWTKMIAVRPGCAYVARYQKGWKGQNWPNYKYITIYVNDYRSAASDNHIIGAKASIYPHLITTRRAYDDYGYLFKGSSTRVNPRDTEFLLDIADKNNDGSISAQEAAAITLIGYDGNRMEVFDQDFADYLPNFPNLKKLLISTAKGDRIRAQPTGNIKIEHPSLTHIWIENGHYETFNLDLSKCPKLEDVNIEYCDMPMITLPAASVKSVRCPYCKLKNLKFVETWNSSRPHASKLEKLILFRNELTSLPNAYFPAIKIVGLDNNPWLHELDTIMLGDGLEELYLEGTNIRKLYIQDFYELNTLKIPTTLRELTIPISRDPEEYKYDGNPINFSGVKIYNQFPRDKSFLL